MLIGVARSLLNPPHHKSRPTGSNPAGRLSLHAILFNYFSTTAMNFFFPF